MKLDILVFAVHPDDAELGCAGTIMAQVALGYKVGILDLTRGELGTRGTPEIRLAEAEAAGDRKSTRLNSSHSTLSRMPSSA